MIARVGGDMNIASVQDTSESSAHQESMGGGFSASMGGASGSFSAIRAVTRAATTQVLLSNLGFRPGLVGSTSRSRAIRI